MYRYLLIDNDDTLMDFHLAERHALGDVLRRHGIPDSEDVRGLYHAINQALWKALEAEGGALPAAAGRPGQG